MDMDGPDDTRQPELTRAEPPGVRTTEGSLARKRHEASQSAREEDERESRVIVRHGQEDLELALSVY